MSLVCEPLDLEELCRPEEGLEAVGLHVDLAAVDVADEALDVGVGRVAQDDHRVRARILLEKKESWNFAEEPKLQLNRIREHTRMMSAVGWGRGPQEADKTTEVA